MAEPISIEKREGFALASVVARKGIGTAQLCAALGFAPPEISGFALAGPDMLLGTGPQTWLVLREGGESDFAELLGEKLAGLASVSDQSSAYKVFRLAGEGARSLLQRGAAVDFHPENFAPGKVAVTQIAHIGVIVWQFDDQPTYFLACFRSFGESLRHWLDEAAAAL